MLVARTIGLAASIPTVSQRSVLHRGQPRLTLGFVVAEAICGILGNLAGCQQTRIITPAAYWASGGLGWRLVSSPLICASRIEIPSVGPMVIYLALVGMPIRSFASTRSHPAMRWSSQGRGTITMLPFLQNQGDMPSLGVCFGSLPK